MQHHNLFCFDDYDGLLATDGSEERDVSIYTYLFSALKMGLVGSSETSVTVVNGVGMLLI